MDYAHMMLNMLAQRGGDEEAAVLVGLFAVLGAFLCGICVVWLAVMAIVCWFLSNALQAIPAEFRKQTPGKIWLLMIPIFGIIWSFFVFPKISDSFKAYFDSVGRTDFGDCGRQMAIILCICLCGGILVVIPCIGPALSGLTGLASLVLLILLLVKFSQLKGQIQSGAAPTA
ncbi:MAG: hypothetical protein FWD53_05210 [Phycisphaerales bacterium]|nr:hypothetical protein [Phycisphaerales bacterium]